jgi:hypothetical protein
MVHKIFHEAKIFRTESITRPSCISKRAGVSAAAPRERRPRTGSITRHPRTRKRARDDCGVPSADRASSQAARTSGAIAQKPSLDPGSLECFLKESFLKVFQPALEPEGGITVTRHLTLAVTAGVLLAASALAQSAAGAAQTGAAQTGAAQTGAAQVGTVQTGAAQTGAQTSAAQNDRQGSWPRHVYAPYVETWTSDSIPQLAAQSGARFFSLAFIQTAAAGSCALAWDGDSTRPIPGSTYQAQIAQLRQMGGDVAPTFGGYSADTTNTEIADSCTDVNQIAAAYEAVITTYHVTRLDMDVEANSLNNTAAIDRRNQAIALTEAWARSHHRPLQIEYTLPVEPDGLQPNALALLQNAIADHARVSIVNIMTFDYYLASEPSPLNMADEAITAADTVQGQLDSLYQGFAEPREGITIMPGIDDYPGKTEITSVQDTQNILRYAVIHRLAVLSIWAIERDNGSCPGTIGANGCSGIAQPTWAFSHLLERF